MGQGSEAKPKPERSKEPAEPTWIAALDSADRRRAHRLIDRLAASGIRDAEGVVRRDLAGDVPTVAESPWPRQLAVAIGDADPATNRLVGRLLDVLADGRDDDLDVRWRLVDGNGRPDRRLRPGHRGGQEAPDRRRLTGAGGPAPNGRRTIRR